MSADKNKLIMLLFIFSASKSKNNVVVNNRKLFVKWIKYEYLIFTPQLVDRNIFQNTQEETFYNSFLSTAIPIAL
jgi:hypothetical protein